MSAIPIEHGELDPSIHPAGDRGIHGIAGFNSVADEAARAALLATCTGEDRNRVVEQTGGLEPGLYYFNGTAFTRLDPAAAQAALASPLVTGSPGTFAYAATPTLDVSAFANWAMLDAMTGDMTLTLQNGVDGFGGVIDVVQDIAGGHKITGITASGRTVAFFGIDGTFNGNPFKAPDARTRIGYEFVTVNNVPLLWITRGSGAVPDYA